MIYNVETNAYKGFVDNETGVMHLIKKGHPDKEICYNLRDIRDEQLDEEAEFAVREAYRVYAKSICDDEYIDEDNDEDTSPIGLDADSSNFGVEFTTDCYLGVVSFKEGDVYLYEKGGSRTVPYFTGNVSHKYKDRNESIQEAVKEARKIRERYN